MDGFDGILTIAEFQKHIQFEVKRVYFIHNLINHENVIRGKHAHKKTEQGLFCIHGNCDVLIDDGENQQIINLNKANEGLFIGTKLWHTMSNFKSNCILVVFASEVYEESDYIRNYESFLNYI